MSEDPYTAQFTPPRQAQDHGFRKCVLLSQYQCEHALSALQDAKEEDEMSTTPTEIESGPRDAVKEGPPCAPHHVSPARPGRLARAVLFSTVLRYDL